MRIRTSFRPSLDLIEPRILATGGVVHALAHHPATSTQHALVKTVAHVIESSNAKNHAAPKSHSTPAHAPTPKPTIPARPTKPLAPASDSAPGAQAWVELINMTNTPINYRLSLAPYDDGTYHTFTIGSGYPQATQYQYAQLTQTGPRSVSDFKIQFGSQAPISLSATGPSEFSAQAYYIFVDGNGRYYVQAEIG